MKVHFKLNTTPYPNTTFYIKVNKKYFEDSFSSEIIERDKLILKIDLLTNTYYDIESIQGEVALGMLPLEHDIEGFWEADRPKGTWDWYTVYKYSIKINDDNKSIFSLQIFNSSRSLLDLEPYKLQFEFDLKNYGIDELFFENELIEEFENCFEFIVSQLMKIFIKEFNAELIEKPKDNI